ncbi:flagellar motor switch protein FliN [Hyphomicrobium methylovorum]|nr:flagellar motor switch protein FliN [Hyphomicrobium methylovorum]
MTASSENESEHGAEATAADFDQALAGMTAAAYEENEKSAFGMMSETSDEMSGQNGAGDNSAMIMGLPVMMKVVLGSAKMPVATLAKLAKGSVVKLDKTVGDPVDILVNGRLIARGEVVVLNEAPSRFGVVLTEVGNLTPAVK